MNRFALGLMASAVLAVALPAAAQSYQGPQSYPGSQAYPPAQTYPGAYGPGASGGYGSNGYGSNGYGGGYDSDTNADGYGRDDHGRGRGGEFTTEIERLSGRVRHEMADGDLSSWQGRALFEQIGGLRRLERQYRYSGGGLDRRERYDLQARLERIKDQVRGGRDRPAYDGGDDGWSNDSAGYGRRGPR